MQRRIKLRYAQNEMAVLEQRDDTSSRRISLSLYELRGVVEFLKNPTEAPYVFYSQHGEPLSVRFNLEDQSYQIERGETVLCGVRGRPEVGETDEPVEDTNGSGKYAFKIFKKLMSRLGRKPPVA